MRQKLFTCALLLVFCTSCIEVLDPDERGIEVDDSIYKLYNQDKTMLLTESITEDHYGTELGNLFEDTKVYWTTTKCPYSDNIAVIHEGVCYAGKMWSCEEMYVAKQGETAACGSALVHEFGHCILMEMRGPFNGDVNHEDDEFWELMAYARRRACDRGW